VVQVTQKRGRRWSAADAFLHPIRKERDNLEVVPGALAQRAPAREVDRAADQRRLGLGRVAPVEVGAELLGERDRDADGASAPGRVPRRTNRIGAGAARAISDRVGKGPCMSHRRHFT
jgi:hypothetical protein